MSMFDDLMNGNFASASPKNNAKDGLTLERRVELQYEMILKLAKELNDEKQKTEKIKVSLNKTVEQVKKLTSSNNRLHERVDGIEGIDTLDPEGN